MENETPLTIDAKATAKKIRDDGRSVTAWARLRELPEGTVSRIMLGVYPHTDKLDSRYQQVLRIARRDGYLVPAQRPPVHSAAA